jgi:hypothetical protein
VLFGELREGKNPPMAIEYLSTSAEITAMHAAGTNQLPNAERGIKPFLRNTPSKQDV